MALQKYHRQWVDLVAKAEANFNSLTRTERVWYTIQCLIGAVENGGYISHYYNSYGERNRETIEDLHYLGFDSLAGHLNQINDLFPSGNPSVNIDERNEVISSWPEGKHEVLLDKLDAEFYDQVDKLESKLLELIENKMNTRHNNS